MLTGGQAVAKMGTRAAYYTLRTGRALAKLGKSLKVSSARLWQVAIAMRKATKWLISSQYYTLIIGFTSHAFYCSLPIIPSVVIGVITIFHSFWPRRVEFLSKNSRKR